MRLVRKGDLVADTQHLSSALQGKPEGEAKAQRCKQGEDIGKKRGMKEAAIGKSAFPVLMRLCSIGQNLLHKEIGAQENPVPRLAAFILRWSRGALRPLRRSGGTNHPCRMR